MLRLSFPLLVLTVLGISAFANPPDDPFQKALTVQTAMARARMLLNDSDAQKAVQVLEESLRHANGNNEYLGMLRDAYRTLVKDLHLAGQPALAKRYLDRLCILDPTAAADPVLRSRSDSAAAKVEAEPVKQGIPFPKFTNPFARKEEPKPVPPTAVRARADEQTADDPFDPKFQREPARDSGKVQEYLALGIQEFVAKRYAEASRHFEKAYQLDRDSLEQCREQWAYCTVRCVSDRVEQSTPAEWSALQKQVESAIKMSPKLASVGQDVLALINQRAKQASAVAAEPGIKVKHLGTNPEGWLVAETAHFFIYHHQDNAFAEQVAQVVERTRLTMYRKWFGRDNVEWERPCVLVMHPDGASYTRMTGQGIDSPGHSCIDVDKSSGRIVSRRMDIRCDIRGMLDTVLPHETTHAVLAGMFGNAPPPRWADEGIAVLSESNEKIQLYRQSLIKNHQEGKLFGLKELMELKSYPQPNRVPAFYAQSVVVAEFLTAQKGPQVLTEFVRDSMRHGCETALQRHYGVTFAQLEQHWHQQVVSNPNRFAAQK